MTKMTPALVDRLRAASTEDQHLEFKEAKSSFDKEKLRDYCIAIANEGGGYLLLGVANTPVGGVRAVVGTRAFLNSNELELYILGACKFRVDVGEVTHPDGRVLMVAIPGRPKGVPLEAEGRYLMRAGESLVAMSQDRLRQIFAESAPHWGEEVVREGVAAQDVVALLDTQGFFELLKLPYPTAQAGAIERLQQKRVVMESGGGTYNITRLGALLLAKQLADFPEIARRAPRVVVYQGSTKLQTRIDQVSERGYAVGFRPLVSSIMTQIPRREVVTKALRQDVTLVPEIVIRELVANALVHQDLSVTGTSPMVEIYDDRIEISNPGTPIVEANRFIDGHESRNEHMAELMRLFGICEEKGSGIDRVIMAAEASHLSAPDIRVGHNRTHVIVFGPREFSDTTIEERIRACFQHCALRWVSGDHMTNQSLRARFHLPEAKSSNVSQVISATIDAKLVKPDNSVGGSRKYARYLPFWA